MIGEDAKDAGAAVNVDEQREELLLKHLSVCARAQVPGVSRRALARRALSRRSLRVLSNAPTLCILIASVNSHHLRLSDFEVNSLLIASDHLASKRC